MENETVRRVDYLGAIHFDPERRDGALASFTAEGFLRVDAKLTRTGVFQYSDADGNTWGELRTPDEVFHEDALRSFEMAVMTDDHPDEFVDASNVREVQVGHVGTDVRRENDFVAASIVVTDAKTIRAIAGGKVELSCGYTAQVIKVDGDSDGVPFSARQTNIRGNHVALVSKGRAGPDCRLLVGRGDARNITGDTMEKQPVPALATLTVDGVEHSVPAEVADAFTKLTEVATPPPVEEIPMPTTTNDEATKLRARVDALEAERATARETEIHRIDARVNLVTNAREVLGADTVTTGVTDTALMRAVVLHVNPKLEGRLDANKDAPGYLRASFEAALDLHRSREDAADEIPHALFSVMNAESKSDDVDAEHAAYMNRLTGKTGEA